MSMLSPQHAAFGLRLFWLPVGAIHLGVARPDLPSPLESHPKIISEMLGAMESCAGSIGSAGFALIYYRLSLITTEDQIQQ